MSRIEGIANQLIKCLEKAPAEERTKLAQMIDDLAYDLPRAWRQMNSLNTPALAILLDGIVEGTGARPGARLRAEKAAALDGTPGRPEPDKAAGKAKKNTPPKTTEDAKRPAAA